MAKHSSTQAVHAGDEKPKPYGALTTRIVQTSTHTFEDTAEILEFMRRKTAGEPAMWIVYGRYGNPRQSAADSKIAALHGRQKALLFASGMWAIATTMLSLLCSGENPKHKAGGYTAGRLIMHGGNRRVRQNDWAIRRGKTKTE